MIIHVRINALTLIKLEQRTKTQGNSNLTNTLHTYIKLQIVQVPRFEYMQVLDTHYTVK
jgi:hypothetical protein